MPHSSLTVSKLALKSVAQIVSERTPFVIPSYQRGYRWDKEEVNALLLDLVEFFRSSNPLYCLQPLVVVQAGSEVEVVDGQQRLTTLSLILSHLDPELGPGFDLCYERHGTGLQQLLRAENNQSPDLYYLKRAAEAIRMFLTDAEQGELLRKLRDLTAPAVSFIWYELSDRDKFSAFTRLNAERFVSPVSS